MICDVCGTDKRAQRRCCVAEFARLRRKLNTVSDVLDKVVDERDRLARRLGNIEARHNVINPPVDPWAEETAAE